MRFISAKILNYRQYKNLEFDFSKTCDNDIHAIIASNGVGKTNLLNAINWCLYGKEPHMDVSENGTANFDDSEEDKLSLANVDAIEEARVAGDSVCNVEVSIITETGNEVAEITRSVPVNTKTYYIAAEDKFQVKVTDQNGEPDYKYGSDANAYVNKYLPEAIREYFFFDGEQLLKYFDVNKKKHIEATINSIAQIDSLKESNKHLLTLIQEFRKDLKKKDPQIEEKEKKLATCENNVLAKEKDIVDLKNGIELSEQVINENDAIISGTEDLVNDNNRFNDNQKRINELKEKKEKQLSTLKSIIRQYTILLMMYKKNQQVYEYINANVTDQSGYIEEEIGAIKKTLNYNKCAICGEDIDDELRKKLQGIIEQYDKTGGSNIKLSEIKNDIDRALVRAKDYKIEKKLALDELGNIEDEIDDLLDQNEELQERIKKYSEKSMDEIKIATQEKFEHTELLKRNREKLGAYKENLKTLKDEKKQATEDFNKARETNLDNVELNKKLSFVCRAQVICEAIITEIVQAVQDKMSEETKRIFDELVWKKETYGNIKLTTDYRLKIYHLRTGQSCLKSLSDAEKELLALAFTLSLHEVSGYQNLLFIDTPVGRVSDENRTNFAKVLLEVSKEKQIILAFTPSEFKDEIEEVFRDDVLSNKYKLTSNEFVTKAVKTNGR